MKTNYTRKKKNLLNILIIFFISCSIPSLAQTKYIVEASNTKFTPKDLTIEVGDTVEWHNIEGSHNVDGKQSVYPLNPESFGNEVGAGWTYSHVFSIAGKYDYRCDPHYIYGMTGTITVTESTQTEFNLTINFSEMSPHVGENLWIAVIDKASGKELARKKVVVTVDFSVIFSGIEKDHSYWVNFFADNNGNGIYDAPPTDHAWSLELNNVTGNSTLNFTHNSNFTDIMWQNKLTISFTGMSPHIGEDFQLKVYDKNSFVEIQTIDTVIAEVDFTLDVFGIKNGRSYNIDFYADHNGNGQYDPPPTDHAWRLVLNDVMGDTTLYFEHGTSFTDISVITGISDNYNSIFKMFPNPAHEKVFIETGDFSSSDVQVKIYDITGKLKLSEIHSANERIELNVQQFERGIYFVELNDNNKRQMMKLIKD